MIHFNLYSNYQINLFKSHIFMSQEQTKKTSYYYLSTMPKTHKNMTLEEHEEMKKQKLEKLKKQSKVDKKIFEELGAKTRKQQLEKSKALSQNSPLAADQAAILDIDKTRIRRKYNN